MPTSPELTIVVPVWNAGEFLPVCLASIAAQTFTGWKCVLVDDGSTDGSGAVCDEWAGRDGRFSVIHKPNGGASSARNAGLAAADTPWVYFFDADDAMASCLLEAALTTQKQYPRDLTIWRSTSDWQEYQALPGMPRAHRRCTKDEMQLIFLQVALHTGVNTKLFRRDILTEHGFSFIDPDGRKNAPGEDALFSTRYMELFLAEPDQGFRYLNEPLYFYRRDNPRSIMTNLKKAAPAPRAEMDEVPEPGYVYTLNGEFERRMAAFPDFFAGGQAFPTARHYLHCFAYGVWSAAQLGETLPRDFFRWPAVRWCLETCAATGRYYAFYWPFRWKNAALIAWLFYAERTRSPWFYRVEAALRRLPGPRWNP